MPMLLQMLVCLGQEKFFDLSDVVFVNLSLIVPYSCIMEAPESIQGISFNISEHHIWIIARGFIDGNEVFSSYAENSLVVMRNGKGAAPCEILFDNVSGFNRQLKSFVGGFSEVLQDG